MALPIRLGQVERRLVPALAPEVGRRIEAGALAHPARHEGEAKLRVLLPVPVGRELRQAAKARFAFLERALGGDARADVAADRNDEPALAGLERAPPRLERKHAAVLAAVMGAGTVLGLGVRDHRVV